MNVQEWCIAGLAVSSLATVGFYHANHKFRSAVDDAVAPVKVPERRQEGYDAQDLVDFRALAQSRPTKLGPPALDIYIGRVLTIDIGFAVALGAFGVFCWTTIAQNTNHPLVSGLAMFCGFMSFLYGISDLTEDIFLRSLLRPDRPITYFAAQNAAACTRTKIVTICLSLIAGAVFGLLWVIYQLPKANRSA